MKRLIASIVAACAAVAQTSAADKTINLDAESGTFAVGAGKTYALTFTDEAATNAVSKTGDGSVIVENQTGKLKSWYWKGKGVLTMTDTTLDISGSFSSYGNWNWQTNIFNNCTLTVGGTFVNQCTRNRNWANATVFNGGTYTFTKLQCDGSDAGTGANVYVRGGAAVSIATALYGHRAQGGTATTYARFILEDGTVTIAPAAEVSLSWAFNVSSGAIELLGGTFTAPYIGGGNSQDDYVLGNGGTWIVNKNTDLINASVEHVYVGANGLKISTDYAGTTISRNIENWGDEQGYLEKLGTGTLTLNGMNSTHAETIVSEGTLVLGAAVTNCSAISVAGGTTLDLTKIADGVVLGGLSFNGVEIAATNKVAAGKTVVLATGNLNFGNVAMIFPDIETVGTVYNVFRMPGRATDEQAGAWAAIPIAEVAEVEHVFAATYDEESDTTTFSLSVNKDMSVKRQITITATEGGSVDLPSGKYLVETTHTLTATPQSGYLFTGWTGNVPEGQEMTNPLTITIGDTDLAFEAHFMQAVKDISIDLSQGDATVTVGPGCVYTVTSVTGNAEANLTIAGGGTLNLPDDDLSTAFATLTIDDVTVNAKDGTSLGAGTVLIRNNGGIVFSSAFTLSNQITIENGSAGFLSLAEGTTTIDAGKLVTAGATFTKLGSGQMYSKGDLNSTSVVGTSRWIIDSGDLVIYGEKWGATGFVVEMHEGTTLHRGNNVYPLGMGNLVLRGAKLLYELPYNSINSNMIHPSSAHYAAGSFSLSVLAAKDGTPSYVSIDQGFSTGFTFNVDVAEDSVLDLNCNLRGNGTEPIVALKKTGSGKLRLLKAPYDHTSVNVAEGTLALSGANTRIGKNVTLVLGENAKIELENGAVLDTIGIAESALLAEAQVHVDATTLTNVCADGAYLSALANRGTTGGLFGRTAPASAPTYKVDSLDGKPAFACTSTPGNGLGLACADAAPNTGSEISIYFVAKPRTDLFTFTAASTGKGSTPVCFTSDSGNPNSAGAFRYVYSAANKFSIYFQGNDSKPLTIEDDAVALSKGAFIESVRRDATSASFSRWFGEGDEYTASLTDQTYANFNINNFAFQTYMKGRCNTWQSTTCPMDMGEILVFKRRLTDSEDQAVRGYLAKKWFDSTAAWPALPKTDTAKDVPICVPEGETGVLAVELAEDVVGLKIVKSGEGTLVDMSASNSGTEIVVEEGTLKYTTAESSAISAAAIWFDAADEDVVSVSEDGIVTSVKNKGWAGGAFTPNATAVSGTPTLGAINGVQAVQFDGTDDFLRLTSFTNASPRQLYVYLVNQRDKYQASGTYFSYSQLGSTKNDDAQVGAIFGYDASDIKHGIDAGTVGTDYGDFYNAYPAIDYYLVGDYTVSFGQINSNCLYTSVVAQRNIHGNITSDADRATVNDLFQIGARKNAGDVPKWFFNGKIGEVVVLEQPLNVDQLCELMDYFRAKWMGAAGSKEPPTWLTGRSAATGTNRKITQKADTVVVQNTEPISLTALSLEEGATIARTVACDAAEALFEVSGNVTVEGPVKVELTPFPKGVQPLIRYAGSAALNDDTRFWPVLRKDAYEMGRVTHNADAKLISLTPKIGFAVIVR